MIGMFGGLPSLFAVAQYGGGRTGTRSGIPFTRQSSICDEGRIREWTRVMPGRTSVMDCHPNPDPESPKNAHVLPG
jgi:hypothetical protein